jgi:predicted NUDIX family phosphoesterase
VPPTEEVLVIERRVLEQVGVFQGLMLDVPRYLEAIFAPGVPRFMPRAAAEKNPAFKQIIPYVLVVCGGQCLSYVSGKRAGETRLVGLRSIGIGGHINPVDNEMALFDADFRKSYEAAVAREVAEEISVEAPHADRVVALINDDSTEVGQVHLGIVHLWTLTEPRVSKREQMITQLSFMELSDLQAARDTMETWSAFCLDHLPEMLRTAQP